MYSCLVLDAIGPRETTADACARALRTAILRGELAAGARLPPERELASRMGVTRVTLRAALAQLSATGLLRVRQGSGYTVQDFRRAGGPELLPGLAALAEKRGATVRVARDLLAVRRQLSRAVLERLCEGVSDEARDAIGRAVDELEARIDEGASVDDVAEADLEVVRAIVDATESDVFGVCMNPVIEVSRAAPRLRDAIYAEPRRNVEAFRMLLEWLGSPRRETVALVLAAMEARDEETLARLERRGER